jgi:alkylation response protein AidB-like acyl-CoA dehydrogenase
MRRTIDFLIHEWLGAASLCARPRFADHSADTFRAVLDTCERIAAERFAPLNRQVDLDEPRMVDDRVVLPPAAHTTAKAYVESGMLAAAQDYDIGGMQLPCVVEMAANAFFAKGGIALGGGSLLTTGNANLLVSASFIVFILYLHCCHLYL